MNDDKYSKNRILNKSFWEAIQTIGEGIHLTTGIPIHQFRPILRDHVQN